LRDAIAYIDQEKLQTQELSNRLLAEEAKAGQA